MDNHLHIVIMAGGTGTRFWPYSRNNKPKQFLDVLGTGRSLLQMTYDRFEKIVPDSNVWIVSNDIYTDLLHQQFPDLPDNQLLLEPDKRNTAPCIAYAAYKIRERDPEGIMVVLPSDQVIFNENSFIEAINTACEAADDKKLITIGIQPNRPETGYGYIQYDETGSSNIKKVKNFKEKPAIDLAKQYISSGEYVWNAGIFVWSIAAIINAFQSYQPGLHEIFASGGATYITNDEKTFVEANYQRCESISIDYAVMEKSENVFTVLGDFGWSDLGSWNALHEIMEQDSNKNVVVGDALLYDCKDNFIISKENTPDKYMVVQGLEGYLVANFDDVILISKKSDSDIFRDFVSDVKNKKGDQFI